MRLCTAGITSGTIQEQGMIGFGAAEPRTKGAVMTKFGVSMGVRVERMWSFKEDLETPRSPRLSILYCVSSRTLIGDFTYSLHGYGDNGSVSRA
jgi:hypothetical protein